jgi:hypothetical protein
MDESGASSGQISQIGGLDVCLRLRRRQDRVLFSQDGELWEAKMTGRIAKTSLLFL